MPDNEAGVHIAPHLAGEGGGTDKETLRSNRTGILQTSKHRFFILTEEVIPCAVYPNSIIISLI